MKSKFAIDCKNIKIDSPYESTADASHCHIQGRTRVRNALVSGIEPPNVIKGRILHNGPDE